MNWITFSLSFANWSFLTELFSNNSAKRDWINSRYVGNKLCFCACICPSFFFMQLLVYPLTFFSWYARDVGFSHMNTELKKAFVMQCEDPFQGWWGDCFFFGVLTWLNFVLRVKGCSRVSLLPNRQSSYFFLFLSWKKFQAEIHVALNYEQP